MFPLAGGTLPQRSQHPLRKLVLGSLNSLLTFDESGTVVRFLDSHTAAWSGTLRIVNWAGSTNGGGAHQLFFGTSAQGLTASQLSHIYFFRPAGLPDGNYLARILPTGEVVPVETQPSVSYTRSSNQLVLSWPAGYQLYSSPTVDGPYAPVPGATSPYTVDFSEPQRYFQLRPSQ